MSLADDHRLATRVDEHGKGLTTWERDFVESLLERLDGDRELTDKQRAILERIDDEKVS